MIRRAWTRALRERTAPSPAAIARVRRRLDLQLRPATAELSTLPEVDRLAVQRVRARLRERAARPGWGVRATGLGLAVAAMAMAAVVIGSTEREAPRRELVLAGTGQGPLADHVAAVHDGEGRVRTGPDGVVVDWEIGRLELEVAPHHGVHLEVRTPEGRVRVVGTHLTVERDALGTRVAVARGEVAVACTGDAPERAVGAGEETECWPASPAGLLNRARAQHEADAPAEAVLATVDRALAGGTGDPPVRAELLALRTGALLNAGREREALDAAEAALAAAPDPGRAAALRRTAARLALKLGACERARVQVEALPEGAEERALLLARCDAP